MRYTSRYGQFGMLLWCLAGCGTPDYLPPPRPSPTVVSKPPAPAPAEPAATAAATGKTVIAAAPAAASSQRTAVTASNNPATATVAADSSSDPAAAAGDSGGPTDKTLPAYPGAELGIRTITPESPLSDIDRRRHIIGCLTAISQALEEHRRESQRYPNPSILDENGQPVLSWRVALLPLLGYEDLYKQFKLHQPWDSAHNRKLLNAIPPVFQSPDRGDEKTNFQLLVGNEAAFRRQDDPGPSASSFAGGLQNTLLLAEVDDAAAVPWTCPSDFAVNMADPKSRLGNLRKTGFFGIFGEIGVRFVPAAITPVKLAQTMLLRKDIDIDFEEVSSPADAEEVLRPATEVVAAAPAAPDTSLASASTAATPVTASATTTVPSLAAPPAKPAPPNEASLQSAESLVRNIYEPIYRRAGNREEQKGVARQMLTEAESVRQDTASYFVMLRFARDIATMLGETTIAREAAVKLDETFELDPVEFKLPWLESFVKHASTADALGYIFDETVVCHGQVMHRDDFPHCLEFQRLALATARKLGDQTKVHAATTLKAKADRAKKAYQTAGPALHTLLRHPEDEAANTAIGRYLCLHKGDWAQGILHLAKGNDAAFKSVAMLELENPQAPEIMAAIGDAWWGLGDNTSRDEEQEAFQERAAFWYRRSIDQLPEGLRKVLVRERLKQFESL